MVPFLGRIKYRDIEFEFNREVTELNEQALEVLAESLDDAVATEVRERALQILPIAPKAAIIEAWRFVEGRFIDAARHYGIDVDSTMLKKPLKVGEELLKKRHINENHFAIFHHLRLLRNKVVHYDKLEVSPDEAVAYLDSALRLGSSVVTNR